MVTYLYCILTPPRTEARPPGLTGLAGTPVRSVVVRGREALELWVGTVDEGTLRETGQSLAKLALVHNDVVEAALATGRTPLPMRFGAHFADDDALVVDLEKRQSQLIDRLHRVDGAVEMSVLVVPRGKAATRTATRPRRGEPSAGRRYLEAVRERSRSDEQRHREADEAADRVSRALSVLTKGESRSSSPTALAIAHLIWRADVDRYRRALSEVAIGDSFRIIVAGPRAPYSFTSD